MFSAGKEVASIEDKIKLLKSQILQLGVMTMELSDKVDLKTDKKVPEYNVTETPIQASEKMCREKGKVSSKTIK